MDITTTRQLLADDLAAVEDELQTHATSPIALIQDLGKYIVQAGGKRIRPQVLLLAARACHYQGPHAITLAAVIELIHTATLLHDDVVDGSSLRRGRQTANAVFGNSASVLVGDYLFSRAFQMLAAIHLMPAIQALSEATNTIAAGEVLQLMHCHDPEVTEARYFEVIDYKTAKLFEVAAKLGGMLAEQSEPILTALARYGRQLGLAFQLVDDALDYQADAETLGKNIGDDLAEGKPTLPLLYALWQSPPKQADILRQAIIEGSLEHLDVIQQAIASTGAIAYTLASAKRCAGEAEGALSPLPQTPYKSGLQALADFAITRNF